MTALPTVVRHESGAEELFTLALAPDHLAFQGHFPGYPILPGVIQIDWAVRLGTQVFGALGDLCGISNLKFMGIIQPLEVLELRLAYNREEGKLSFQYNGATDRKSMGVICFSVPK